MSLSVKPISAFFEKDTDSVGDSDPYVVLILGQQKKKGHECKGGGVKPTWNQNLTLNAKEQMLTIQVWDKDTFSADDQMGSTTYDLGRVYSSPNTPFKQMLKLTTKGKQSGVINIEFIYNGPPKNQPNQNWGQQGQPNWGNQGNQGNQGQWGQQPSNQWNNQPKPGQNNQGGFIM